jgi:phosphatidylglycerophosphate synthase
VNRIQERARPAEAPESRSLLRHLPNAISAARLASTPVLAWMAATGMERPFSWLLVAALATDALDGLLARAFSWTSRLGSLLDSLADAMLMLVAAYGVWVFHYYVFEDYGIAIWAVLGLWALQHLLAIMRYGRPASFHTRLVRVAVAVFSLFLVTLFLLDFQPWLFFMAVALSLAGVCEELLLIALVPKWTPDLRGGILGVMRRRKSERPDQTR